MSATNYSVPYLRDSNGYPYPCTGLLKEIDFQPKTGDVFFVIQIINMDRCSRRNLYLFNDESEMDKKYEELWNDFRNQMISILEEKKKWI